MTNSNGGDEERIGDYSKQHLLKHALKLVEEKASVTSVFSEEAEAKIPKFQTKELDLGRVLGRGGFCAVSEIQKITLLENDSTLEEETNNDPSHEMIVQNRKFMADYCIRDGNHARYAMKQLSKESLANSDLYVRGLVDLLMESKFLAVLRHAHIIKMRAISSSPQTHCFLVLDRLYETFEIKLGEWNRASASGCPCLGSSSKQAEIWGERLLMACDLASAFKYMHGINIIYRDLKPDNIRFDVRGDVKLFDFGLCRQLNPDLLDENDGLYRLTGDTGSIIYMAPEVALNQNYNETVDVYSFGILLWQICSGKTTVYENFNYNMILKSIVKGGARPAMDNSWSKPLQSLINNCWSKDISKRPSMEKVMEGLYAEMRRSDIDADLQSDELDASTKSMHSLHAKKLQQQQQQ